MSMAECSMLQFDVFLFRGADWGHRFHDSGVMPLHVACGFRPERTCPKVIECAAFILDQLKAAADAFAEDESLDLPPDAFQNVTAAREKPRRASPSRIGSVIRVVTSGSEFARSQFARARIPAAIFSARVASRNNEPSEMRCLVVDRSGTNRARGRAKGDERMRRANAGACANGCVSAGMRTSPTRVAALR